MLFGKLAKYGTRLAPALVLGLTLTGSLLVPVKAQEPLYLELGGEGATSWSIENIKPGDTGTKTVTLRNDASVDGLLIIWISDIVSSEGANPESETGDTAEPGELINYLLFNISFNRLKTNISLPATLSKFPQTASDANFIWIDPLYAYETIDLFWEWEFRETGVTQNDAQGDSLSFTINYMLSDLPYYFSGSGGRSGWEEPSLSKLEIDILGKVTVTWVSTSGMLIDSLVATDPDNKQKLEFKRYTKITSASSQVISRIEMRVCKEPPSPPYNTEIIGPAYDIIGYTGNSVVPSIMFDKPVKLTVSYDPKWLPENTSSIFIAWYDVEQDWQELKLATDRTVEPGEITALISHASTFAILAELASVEPVPPESVPVESVPAETAPAEPEEISSTTTILPQTREEIPLPSQNIHARKSITPVVTEDKELLRQSSLAVAVAGVIAMTILAYIQRRRRAHHYIEPVDRAESDRR
jgi:hypothetical protein